MSRRPLRVEHAREILPDVEDLLPLKRALIGASREDAPSRAGGWGRYATVEVRSTDVDDLARRVPELVRREAERAEVLYQAVIEALRASEEGDGAAAARSLIRAGEAEEAAGRLRSASSFFERARELGSRLPDRREQALAVRRLARVAKMRGELTRSLELYQASFELSEASFDSEGCVVSSQGMGNVLVERGLWKEAEEWYLRGLEMLQSGEASRALWQLQSNLSLVARRAGDLDSSRRWLDDALATVEEQDDEAGRVYVLNAEGMLLVALGRPGEAEERYRTALDQATSPAELARVMVNLSESLLLQEKLVEAESILRRLELLTLTEGMTASLVYAYRGLGAVARARRDPEGFLFYEQALQLGRSEELPELEWGLTQLEYGEFEADQQLTESAAARLEEARDCFARIGTEPERQRAEERLRSLNNETEANADI